MFILAIVMLALAAAPSFAQTTAPGITVFFNGKPIYFDSKPIIEEGRTLVPFRAIFEKVNATVNYDSAKQQVIAVRGTTHITLTIGSKTAVVNGQSVTLDVPPKIVDRRTLVPLRFVGEAMGADVRWNHTQKRADINDAKWPPRGGTVTWGIFSAPAGIFNPHIASNVYDAYVNDMVFSSLWQLDRSLTPQPSLATHWTVSPDNKTLTFYLREGVKFHDGRPVTIDDVLFSFMAFMDPGYKGPRSTGWDSLVGYDDYKAGKTKSVAGLRIVEGGKAIQFQLKEVNAPFFINNTGHGILPKHLYQNVPVADWGTARDPNNAKPIGSGPFKFGEYQPGQFVIMQKNPDYFFGAPYLDRVILKVVAQEVMLAELQTGKVDISEILIKDLPTAQKNPRISVIEYPDTIYQYMSMNTARAPLNDKRVRQAVAYAIDKPAIISGIKNGHASEMLTPIHPLFWAYSTDVERYDFNVAKANALLDEAGWRMGSDGYRSKDGKRLKLSLLYPTGNVDRMNTGPVVQQMLKAVGIEVTLDLQEFAVLLTKSTAPQYDFDLLFLGFRVGVEPDQQQIWGAVAIKEGGFNRSQWTTPKSEELLLKGRSTMNIEERKAAYAEWQKHYTEEMPALQLYAENRLIGVSKKVGNFKERPVTYHWNLDEWFIYPGP